MTSLKRPVYIYFIILCRDFTDVKKVTQYINIKLFKYKEFSNCFIKSPVFY